MVFGTEMHWVTLLIITLQVLILFYSTIHYLSKPQDKSRLHFLVLVLVFIQYNFFSGIFPDDQIAINLILQNTVAYIVGIVMALYFLFYLYEEFHITPFKFFDLKSLIILCSLLLVFTFIIPYSLTRDLRFSRLIFIIIPLLLCIVFVFRMYYELNNINKDTNEAIESHFKSRVIASYAGLFSLISLPIMVFLGDHQVTEQILVNIGFFWIGFSYIKANIYRSRMEFSLLNEYRERHKSTKIQELFNSHKLTNKEVEIAMLILRGDKYKAIADKIFITEKTVSKHASNMFKKVNVTNRKEFVSHFKG